ncbi:DUF4349 domain-containing protein [Actinokineospora iranica]|uniref:DUF4349 domain-containing protein n=1 Tax=Actinokineospora iranica TaxID=1271860 RepID=A0A1G6UMD4_9PSEU|nr:DUF4349 domain-containing protein [Actinokineospora iranica]SDD42590.1 protein of unknown function [Actinokineospora iranica]
MRGRLAGLALVLAAVGGGAACTAEMSSTSGAAPERAAVAPQAPAAGAGAGDSAGRESRGEPARQDQQVSQPGVDRKLVRSATLEIAAPRVAEAADTARGEAIAVGGYAGQEQIGEHSATLTLHVPSDKLDAVLQRLTDGSVGQVRSRNQTAEDVTEQLIDVESRIETQRASLNRVRALLDRATDISEIVRLESEVTRREADLDSLLKRREGLAGSVAMSTVTLRIAKAGSPAAPVTEDEDDFLDALAAGWGAFLDAGNLVLRVVGAALPFAVALGVPAYVVWRIRRRRPAAAPPAPATAPEAG